MARCEGKAVCLAYQSDGTECSCLQRLHGVSADCLVLWPPVSFVSGAKLQRQALPSSGATAY